MFPGVNIDSERHNALTKRQQIKFEEYPTWDVEKFGGGKGRRHRAAATSTTTTRRRR